MAMAFDRIDGKHWRFLAAVMILAIAGHRE